MGIPPNTTGFETHGQSHPKSETKGTSDPSKFTPIQKLLKSLFTYIAGVFEPLVDGTYLLTAYALSYGAENGLMYIKNNDNILCQALCIPLQITVPHARRLSN